MKCERTHFKHEETLKPFTMFVLRSKMQSQLLLLLALCTCNAVRSDTDINGDAGDDDADVGSSRTKVLDPPRERRSVEFTNDLLYIDIKKKRAIESFSNVLNAILSSTHGFATLNVNGREMKLYVKIGSYADAEEDFNSLGPNSVTQISPRMITGVVDGYTVGLRSQPPTLYIINGNKSEVPRQGGSAHDEYIFRYFYSVQEAKLALPGRWGEFSARH